MTQNGQFVKRGVLTSRDMVEPGAFPHTSVPPITTELKREIILNPPAGGPPTANIIINKPPLTAEELNDTKYFNSLGVRNGRPDYPFTIHQTTTANSNFVPPPPSRFLVSSGHHSSSGSHPSQLPVFSNHPQLAYPQGHPLYQSVRKTYIPHHIYNEIPLLSSETKYVTQEQHEQQQVHVEEEEAEAEEAEINAEDERMLEEYNKLYQKYQEERNSSVILQRKVEFLENELAKNQREDHDQEDHPIPEPIIREVIKTKEVYVAKPTRIDTRQLASILAAKIKPVMDETFQRRKTACLNKLRGLLGDQEAQIKATLIRSSEELTSRR